MYWCTPHTFHNQSIHYPIKGVAYLQYHNRTVTVISKSAAKFWQTRAKTVAGIAGVSPALPWLCPDWACKLYVADALRYYDGTNQV